MKDQQICIFETWEVLLNGEESVGSPVTGRAVGVGSPATGRAVGEGFLATGRAVGVGCPAVGRTVSEGPIVLLLPALRPGPASA